MSILQNAIDSIHLGIEDYELIENNPKRLISCTRNLFSGILLLFKHHLASLSNENSDEVLIKQTIIPQLVNGEIVFVGKGKKTVDVQGIQERFNSLGININWKELEKIQNYRNNIEHYFSNENPKTIQAILANSFNLINEFVRGYLNQEPTTLLGKDYWQKLLDVKNVYDTEKSECLNALSQNTYFNMHQEEIIKDATCSNCGSDLIKPLDIGEDARYVDYECKACQHQMKYEDVISNAVSEECKKYYGYYHYKDGGADPYTVCPECQQETYSMEECCCLSCEYEAQHVCSRCEEIFSPAEVSYNEGLCSYCQYQWDKIQDE